MPFRYQPLFCCVVISLAFAASQCGIAIAVFDESQIDFATQIRPLLSDRCFICHGPDAATRATSLRLDDPESTYQFAVIPGNVEESELIRRIESTDPDQVMPPPDSNLELTEQQRQLLRGWVESGAVYDRHWSLVPAAKVNPPELPVTSPWFNSGNPIDAFVGARLEEIGLAVSPEADRTTLIRRLMLDLIGLPPAEEQIAEFEQSAEQDALEILADRLLDSPRFGEKWAIDWLDVARYADTHGYQADVYRETWPWRDWVIEALNRNLPFDQFITWQLAGDLLPNPTGEQILATAFNRLHRQTNEGGSVEEEFRAEYVADRVNTFGAAFLGLTLECARCHDHKYDPITQREYYQLAAFFNSIDESGLYSHFTSAVPTPALQLASSEQRQRLEESESLIKRKATQLAELKFGQSEEMQGNCLTSQSGLVTGFSTADLEGSIREALKKSQVAHYRFESIEQGKVENSVNASSNGSVFDDPQVVPGFLGNGLSLSGENGVNIPEGGRWTRNQPFTIALWLKTPELFERSVILHRSRAWTDAASRGYELLIEEGCLSVGLIHFWPGNAIRVVSRNQLPVDQWTHVVVSYDGSSSAAGLRIYIDGRPAETVVIRDNLTQPIFGSEANQVTIGSRFRDVGFKLGSVDELLLFETELSQLECMFLYWQDTSPEAIGQKLADSNPLLQHHFLRRLTDQVIQLEEELFQLRREYSQYSDPIPQIMVMREMEVPRPTMILHRGEYDAPGDVVQRGVPGCLPPLDLQVDSTIQSVPSRLDLANWLTHPDHPLTARVAVNRVWQSLFGRGLVETTEDFGFQGSPPSHSQLLDFLARKFIDSGWDFKSLIRLIVTSQTYRQSSDVNPQVLEADPENIWFGRGPAFRLGAELVRDSALAASGLLANQMGGPPVKPYQPEGLWEEKSGAVYHRDVGEGSRRRSVYTYWKRTSPPPSLMTFDASNREVCTVRRQTTMTPLQTLVMLNDPQFVEAARGLAESVYRKHTDSRSRLVAVFRRLTSRTPTESELEVLLTMLEQQRQEFLADPHSAEQLLQVGDFRVAVDSQEEQVELAALSAIAGGLMSYDEFLMRR